MVANRLMETILALLGRGRKTSTLMVYFFIQGSTLNILTILSTTLFLQQLGAKSLPLMYIAVNVLSIILQVTTAANPNFSSFRLLNQVTMITIGFLIVSGVTFWNGLVSDDGHLSVIATIVLFGFIIGSRIFESFSSALFFNIVYELYPIREAKMKVPHLLTIGSVGVILTGFSVKPIMTFISVPLIILICAAILFFDYLLLQKVGSLLKIVGVRSSGRQASAEDQAAQEAALSLSKASEHDESFDPQGLEYSMDETEDAVVGKTDGPEPQEELPPGWVDLLDSPLIRTMALVTILATFLKFFLDFQFSRSVEIQFPNQADLAAFLGMYESVLTIVVLGIQAFLTAPVFLKYKIGTVSALLPVCMVVLCLMDAGWPTFLPIILTKFIFSILSNGFYKPSGTILLGPFASRIRERARLVITAATSLGCLSVGIALSIGLKEVSPRPYFLMMTGMALSAYYLSRSLDKNYQATLSENLKSADKDVKIENVRALRVVSGDYAVDWMLELLHRDDTNLRMQVLREVKYLNKKPARRFLQKVLDSHTDERLRSYALKEASICLGTEALDLLKPHLEEDDPRIRANAIEAIAMIPGSSRAIEAIRPFLNDPHHRIRGAAIHGILEISGAPSDLELAIDRLVEMVRSSKAIDRASAAAVMGLLEYPFFLDPLIHLVQDDRPQVVTRAIESLEALRAHEAVPVMSRLAEVTENAALRERYRQACERIEDETASTLMQVMGQLSAEERQRMKDALSGIKHGVRAQVILRALTLKSARTRESVIAYLHTASHVDASALVQECLSSEPPSIRPALDAMRQGRFRGERAISRLISGFMNQENSRLLYDYLKEVWDRVRATLILAQEFAPSDHRQDALARRRRRLLSHGFLLVSLRSIRPSESVEVLDKALEGDRFVASMSYELLIQHVGQHFSKELIPLLEDLREPSKMKRSSSEYAIGQERELIASATNNSRKLRSVESEVSS